MMLLLGLKGVVDLVAQGSRSTMTCSDLSIQLMPLEAEEKVIAEKLLHRRKQVLVHSYIYYELGQSIVEDALWDKWAREVVQLQTDYPDIALRVDHHNQFIGFDATTGFHFMYDEDTKHIADRLLWYYNSGQLND